MLKNIIILLVGASAGVILRWFISVTLNHLFPLLPLGTLTVNLVGCYFAGLALSFFASFPGTAPEWRLLIMTGFLGALTTFSTFSSEVAILVQETRYLWAGITISSHVIGSLTAVFLGIVSFGFFRKFFL